jgi:hypothetical protein
MKMDRDGDDDIPSPDIRVRAKLLEYKNLPALQRALDEFLSRTGIRMLQDDIVLWLKAILLVQNPRAFDETDERHDLTLTDMEKKMLKLDREPRKAKLNPHRRLPTFQRNRYERWRHLPWQHWKILILCALAAVIQGCKIHYPIKRSLLSFLLLIQIQGPRLLSTELSNGIKSPFKSLSTFPVATRKDSHLSSTSRDSLV